MKMSSTFLKLTIGGALLACALQAGASGTDDRIVAAAKNSYAFKTYLKDDAITVKSENGVVLLTGSVSRESDKTLAGDTVAELPGVKSVDNRLAIEGSQPKEMSDDWIALKVKTALLFHRHVSAVKTNVDVKDGVVTLRGEAATQAQKDLTAEYARDVDGVKQVINSIAVVPTDSKNAGNDVLGSIRDQIDDASITAEVKIALLSHRSTSAISTSVKTSEGVVTVSGKAKNEAEKELVTKLVEDINGVRRVNNLMTVEGNRAPTHQPSPSPAQNPR